MKLTKEVIIGVLVTSLDILAKKLEVEAKGDDEIGYEHAAAEKRQDMKAIKEGLRPRILDGAWSGLKSADKEHLKKGLRMYIHNERAAAGTLTGLGKTEWAGDLKAEATVLDERLLVAIDSQGDLFAASSLEELSTISVEQSALDDE